MQVAKFNHKTSPLYVHETHLYNQLNHIFPNAEVIQGVQTKLNIKNSSGKVLEFDVWIPKYNLCFEFQDAYHYITTWYYQWSRERIHRRDTHIKNLTLIIIPCWWNGSVESLTETIHFHRPDLELLCRTTKDLISLNPPPNYFSTPIIPDVGELMLAAFPPFQFDLSNPENGSWWMGEKYDGIRCCWNPLQKKSFGKVIPLKNKMYSLMPKIFIDSELWFGRGEFSSTFNLIHNPNCDWHFLRMLSFDVPSYDLRQLKYEKRYEFLLDKIDPHCPFNRIAMRMKCKSNKVGELTQNIIENEGEGVILQQQGSLYHAGRSQHLLKLKATMADQEGIVVGVNPEVVVLKLPNGTTFSIPNTPTSILIPNIASGQIVTFTFETRARRDVPTRPVIVRERRDLSWNDVVRSLQHDLQNNTRHVPDFSQVKGYAKEKGYWTPTTMRAHMIQFAKDNLSDPFDPEFWVNAFSSFSKSRSGRTIISKFSHGYSQAVRVLFPEIVFDSHKFAQQAFYKVENRRKFFENYAAKHEFDPLVPDNWYNQSKEDILSSKGALRLMQYHGNSVPKALCDLFPNIGLDRHKFPYTQRLWEDPNNRRKFFEIYAENNNFDPLIANNWYSQPIYQIMAVKGADRLLGYHGSSIAKALSDLFPDIGIDRSKFLYQQNYWNKVENRREFYEEYAAEQGFDPLIANNWYSISRDDLLSISDARKIICYHRNSVIVSLMDLFPDIGIDKAKFLFKQNHKWNSAKNRRELFENYAKENKMDPLIPQNWYKQPRQKILSFPGVWKAITYHNSSLVTTLIDLFPEIGLKKANFLLSQRNFVKDDNRRFFEKYAADNRFDPLSAEKWYTQPKDKILATKGVHRVLAHYSNSIPKALVDLFPEIGLDRMKFPMTQENWDTPMRRRQFFEKYAKEYSFNPLDPHNWYLQPKTQILDTKGAQSVLSYHNNSVSKALMDLFPDIGLDNTKFVSQSDYWSNKENQRKYFETFAKEKGFDPLESENWKFSLIGQLQSKRAIKILANYGGNLYNALTSVFPEVIFDKQKIYFDQNMWVKVGERRNFFENFAKENGFNPLIPANWYAQSKDKIMATKGAKKVISHHGVSVAKALLDLFPDIGLDKTKLLFRETGWIQANTRRKFFEDYAALHSFDSLVPENWYSTAKNQILLQKGAWGVISHHQNSISQALLDLFPEIGLQKLSLTQPLSYESEDSRRLYFENFAKSNNFDHLKYENWSDKIKESFLSLKATTKVLSFHKYKLSRALKELFPEMKIVKENRSLNSAENRRKFFEKYAQDNGFDALVANNWYLQSKDKIMAVKGAWTVICYHNRSTSKALLDLFPEIGLDKSKLRIRAG